MSTNSRRFATLPGALLLAALSSLLVSEHTAAAEADDKEQTLPPSVVSDGVPLNRPLQSLDFWRTSAGWWSSDNTYLDGALQQKLAAYQSIVHIELQGSRAVETTYKFYPPGEASRYYSKGRVSEEQGVELVTVVEMAMIDGSGSARTIAVTPAMVAQPGEMTTTPLSSTLALQRNVEPTSGRDNYHTLITMPTADRRYTAMFGVYTGRENGEVEAGDLRGLALFAGRRIAESEVETARARFRAANVVGAVVSGTGDGGTLVQLLD